MTRPVSLPFIPGTRAMGAAACLASQRVRRQWDSRSGMETVLKVLDAIVRRRE